MGNKNATAAKQTLNNIAGFGVKIQEWIDEYTLEARRAVTALHEDLQKVEEQNRNLGDENLALREGYQNILEQMTEQAAKFNENYDDMLRSIQNAPSTEIQKLYHQLGKAKESYASLQELYHNAVESAVNLQMQVAQHVLNYSFTTTGKEKIPAGFKVIERGGDGTGQRWIKLSMPTFKGDCYKPEQDTSHELSRDITMLTKKKLQDIEEKFFQAPAYSGINQTTPVTSYNDTSNQLSVAKVDFESDLRNVPVYEQPVEGLEAWRRFLRSSIGNPDVPRFDGALDGFISKLRADMAAVQARFNALWEARSDYQKSAEKMRKTANEECNRRVDAEKALRNVQRHHDRVNEEIKRTTGMDDPQTLIQRVMDLERIIVDYAINAATRQAIQEEAKAITDRTINRTYE